jgi:hypothetical protein
MQQINLYTHLPHPVKSLLDARALLVLFGVFCLMLMLSYGVGLLQRHHDNVKLERASQQFETAQLQIKALVLKYPSAVVQAPDVTKLIYCKFKFSTYLEAFAAAIVPGVWLTNISISAHGASLAVKGHALLEGQAQLYAEQLNNESLFKQTPLVLQDIMRNSADDKKAANMLSFRIATKVAQDNG